MNRLAKIALLLLALLLLAAIVYARRDAPQSPSAAAKAQAVKPTLVNEGNKVSRAAAMPLATPITPPQQARPYAAATLPPRGQPLRDMIDALQKADEAGNYRASCRLAAELICCQSLAAEMRALEKAQLAALPAEGEEKARLTQKVRTLSAEVAQDKKICEGFDNRDKLEPWRYMLKAALGGHAASMTQFAIAPPWDPFDFVGQADAWAVYRDYGAQFLAIAAKAGDKRAVQQIAQAYAGNPLLPADQAGRVKLAGVNMGGLPGKGINFGGVKLAEPDPAKAALYGYASAGFGGGQDEIERRDRLMNQLQKQLTPSQLAAAKAEADALMSTWPPEVLDFWNKRQADQAPGYDELCEH